jgi:ParB family chromosome partitioning protein
LFPITVFHHLWDDMATWWVHYDPNIIGPALSDERWEAFTTSIDGSTSFRDAAHDALRAARTTGPP